MGMTWKKDILEVASMVVTWWIVAFVYSGSYWDEYNFGF